MSLAELTSRARQGTSRWIDRTVPQTQAWRPLGGILPKTMPPERDLQAATAAFAGVAGRFFAGASDDRAIERLRRDFPAHGRDLARAADESAAGRVNLLGYDGLPLDKPIDWHRDVVSGRRAPLVHWTRIDPLAFGSVGDSKVTWELNRHQWLVALAQAAVLAREPHHAHRAVTHLLGWIEANPYGIGINWTSSLEASYRLIAWCWVLVLLRQSSACSTEVVRLLLGSIWMHARHVERYLSRFFSPNTHLTGEALGLFYAGVLFPEFEAAARWRELGRDILDEQSRRQIAADGVYFEQTTCYQRYTIELYLHFLLLAARNRVAVPAGIAARVQRMLDFLIAVGEPPGLLPQIGDADGGWLLPLATRSANDCRGVLAVAAACFGRGDFAWAAGAPAPEVAWFLGGDGADAFDRLEPAPPTRPASRVFSDGGYVVMRSGWARNARLLIVDAGPLGCPISGAHGHADLLSVQCSAHGERYLVDPGTYSYTGDAVWRDHFRGVSAHNTASVDGEPLARPVGPFAWETRPVATLDSYATGGDHDFADASHQAYARLVDPVTHRRRVLFVARVYWLVVDDLVGAADHQVAVRFQFSPRPVTLAGNWAFAHGRNRAGLWLGAFASGRLESRIREGGFEPIEGWVSDDYGRRTPAPLVTFAIAARLPARIATLILPVEEAGTTPPRVEPLHDGTGALVGLAVVERGETIDVADDTIVLTLGSGSRLAFGGKGRHHGEIEAH
jgi:hypothetical protein